MYFLVEVGEEYDFFIDPVLGVSSVQAVSTQYKSVFEDDNE